MIQCFVPCSILLIISFGINFFLFDARSIFDNQRYLQVGALALILFSFLDRRFFTVISNSLVKHRMSAGLMVGSAFLAVFLSRFPYYASLEFLNTLLLSVLALYVARCVSNLGEAFEYIVVTMLLICFSLYYFQFFIGYVAGLLEGTSTKREVLVHHFSSVRYLNHLQALFLPYFFYQMLFGQDRRLRFLAWVVGVLSVIVMLYCSARGALLGSALGLVCVCVFYRKMLSSIVLKLFIFLLLSVLGYIALFEFLPDVFGAKSAAPSEINTTSSSRIDMWIEVISLSSESLFFGLGPMHYGFYSGFGFGHPHNIVLQLLTDYGLIALIGASVCISKVISAVNRAHNQGGGGNAYLAWVSCLVSVFVLAMFSGVWVAPMTQLGVVFCVGMVLSPLFKTKYAEYEAKSGGLNGYSVLNTLVFRLALLLGLLFVWYASYSQFSLAELGEGAPLYSPRFWLQMNWPAE